jgi:hypothetical protein
MGAETTLEGPIAAIKPLFGVKDSLSLLFDLVYLLLNPFICLFCQFLVPKY